MYRHKEGQRSSDSAGTEKCSLFTIGKYKKPRCFRGVSVLPTEYEASPNAWMTAEFFETWLQKWNNRLARHGRKIVLFVDNCTAHPHIEDLESIELIFLPPNTASEIQPCDQGIIKTMKTYYRKSMVQSLIRAINNGSTTSEFKLTLVDSLEMLRWAWELVTPTAISKCFHKAGFELKSLDPGVEDDPFCDLEDPTSDQGEDDQYTELHLEEPCTFEQYLSVDEKSSVCSFAKY